MKKNILFIALISAMYLLSNKAMAGGCLPFSFTVSTDTASCPYFDNGSATVTATGGTAPYTYLWSASAGSQVGSTATNLPSGNHTVIVTDMMGCIDSIIVTIYEFTVPAPDICMVTCDGSSTNNIIYWDKTMYAIADSFIVYREVSPSVYSRIAAISRDSLSEYVDTSRSVGPANGDPNIASYRYKLQLVDTCGNYGLMGLFHNTIYIEDGGSGLFSWSIPYTIEGVASPVNNYILLCDTANVDVWGPVSTVSGSASAATDPGFASHGAIANWRVKTDWGISCTPTRATVNTSRSNIKHALATVVDEQQYATMLIYPNPAAESITVELSDLYQSGTIRITNMLGQVIYSENFASAINKLTVKRIDVSSFSKGLYTLTVAYPGGAMNKKVSIGK